VRWADLGALLAALGAQQRHHPRHFSFALRRCWRPVDRTRKGVVTVTDLEGGKGARGMGIAEEEELHLRSKTRKRVQTEERINLMQCSDSSIKLQ
jgi:hypothetical protein